MFVCYSVFFIVKCGVVMKNFSKVNISMPTELLECIEDYADFKMMSRSGAIGWLLACALAVESERTNGFDFDTPWSVEYGKDGREIIVKRSDIVNGSTVEWFMSAGKNRRQETIVVNDKDFDEDITIVNTYRR